MTPEEFNETRQAFKKSTFEDFDTFVFKMLCYVPSDAASFIEEANQIILFRFRKYLDAPEEQLSADQVAFRKQAVQTLENDLKDAYQRFITNAKKDHHISDETIENHLKYLNQKYCSDSQKKESTDE